MENTKKSFGEIWSGLTTEQTEYLKGYIDRQRQDAVKHYQADVGQQRELLVAFYRSIEGSDYLYPDECDMHVDDFLESN